MVEGSQFTIVWHVDDLKLSHKNPKVVTRMINPLKGLYEKLPNVEIKKMSVQRGKLLNYLGMKSDLAHKESMPYHIDNVIQEFLWKLRNIKQ